MNLLAYPCAQYLLTTPTYGSHSPIQLIQLIPSAPNLPRLDGEPVLIRPRASSDPGVARFLQNYLGTKPRVSPPLGHAGPGQSIGSNPRA
jgi:hypothetical protein